MNKQVRKRLNTMDDHIAEAKRLVERGEFRAAAVELDRARDSANLAAAEVGKAQQKHAASKFARNTEKQRS